VGGCSPDDKATADIAMSAKAHNNAKGRPLKYSLICSLVDIALDSEHKKDKKDNHLFRC
jgi:hypothetical protein